MEPERLMLIRNLYRNKRNEKRKEERRIGKMSARDISLENYVPRVKYVEKLTELEELFTPTRMKIWASMSVHDLFSDANAHKRKEVIDSNYKKFMKNFEKRGESYVFKFKDKSKKVYSKDEMMKLRKTMKKFRKRQLNYDQSKVNKAAMDGVAYYE